MRSFYCDIPQGLGGVYRIRNVKTGHYYIGAAKNLRARMSAHVHLFIFEMHTKLLQTAAKRHGVGAFVLEVLLLCEPEWLERYEAALIKMCNPAYNYHKDGGRPRRSGK
jgi:group I intron endonuclease